MIHFTTSHISELNPQSVSSSLSSPRTSVPTPAAIKIEGMQAFLSQFDKYIDALVYLYLQSIANDGMVCQSGYAIARQLGIYRVTLSRILNRLEQQCITGTGNLIRFPKCVSNSPCPDIHHKVDAGAVSIILKCHVGCGKMCYFWRQKPKYSQK